MLFSRTPVELVSGSRNKYIKVISLIPTLIHIIPFAGSNALQGGLI